MKPRLKTILGTLVMAFLLTVAFGLLPAQTRPQPASAAQASDKYDGDCTGNETAGRCADKPFDHSNCQYPLRTTNPVDGCDNSDPCDPANAAKGGSGECAPATIEPVQPTQTTEPTGCIGK